jgi:hypothetical protein
MRVLLLLCLLFPLPALADPGSLDAHGCHYDRITGDYHCHMGDAHTAERPRSNLLPVGKEKLKHPWSPQGPTGEQATHQRHSLPSVEPHP